MHNFWLFHEGERAYVDEPLGYLRDTLAWVPTLIASSPIVYGALKWGHGHF